MEDIEKIYSEYYDIVFGYAMSICKDEQWAEELTQEVFFKAIKSIKSFKGECKLSVWLCQIVKNTFYTELKRKKRQIDSPIEIIEDNKNIEQKVLDKATAFDLHKILHLLGEPYKEVFWMRTFGELSFKEIGIIFGKTESWARVTYHRARLKIKENAE